MIAFYMKCQEWAYHKDRKISDCLITNCIGVCGSGLLGMIANRFGVSFSGMKMF